MAGTAEAKAAKLRHEPEEIFQGVKREVAECLMCRSLSFPSSSSMRNSGNTCRSFPRRRGNQRAVARIRGVRAGRRCGRAGVGGRRKSGQAPCRRHFSAGPWHPILCGGSAPDSRWTRRRQRLRAGHETAAPRRGQIAPAEIHNRQTDESIETDLAAPGHDGNAAASHRRQAT